MIITIIAIALFIIGVVLIFVSVGSEIEWTSIPGVILTLIGFLASTVILINVVDVQVGRNIEYEKKLHERNMLVYRLEQAEEDNNVVEYAELYNDIVCFNNSIRKTKAWHDNPWVNWFYNPLIADLEYIEVTGTEESK